MSPPQNSLQVFVPETLESNSFGDAECENLAAISDLGHLGYLDLSRNRIGNAGVRTLAAAPGWAFPARGLMGRESMRWHTRRIWQA